jgi:hypothetical protein
MIRLLNDSARQLSKPSHKHQPPPHMGRGPTRRITMETRVSQAYVTIHTNTAKPVGMVPLSINIGGHVWTVMIPEDEYKEATTSHTPTRA